MTDGGNGQRSSPSAGEMVGGLGHPDATKTPSTRPGSAGTQVPFAAHEFSPVHRFSFYKCGAAPPCLMETSHSCRIVQGLRTTSPVATTHPRQRHGSLSAMRAPVLGSSGGAPCALPQFRGRSPQPLRFYLAALYFQHSAVCATISKPPVLHITSS